MGLFNIFKKKKELSQIQKQKLIDLIEMHRAVTLKLNNSIGYDENDEPLEIDDSDVHNLVSYRRRCFAIIQNYERENYAVTALKCHFYTSLIGDRDWIYDPENIRTVSLDFSYLRSFNKPLYNDLAHLLRESYKEYWGREEINPLSGEMDRSVPSRLPFFPEKILNV